MSFTCCNKNSEPLPATTRPSFVHAKNRSALGLQRPLRLLPPSKATSTRYGRSTAFQTHAVSPLEGTACSNVLYLGRLDTGTPEGRSKIARVYVAFRPPHLHAADAASLCVRHLHEELIRLYENPYDAAAWLPTARTEDAVRELLYYYSTTLTYVGSKSRGFEFAKPSIEMPVD